MKEYFKFIDFENREQWDLEYDSDTQNIKQLFGDSINNGVKLRDKCEALKSLDSVISKEELTKVRKYCGIRKISDQLERKNKKYLFNLSESAEEVAKKWNAWF